jgi:hypothetical protein
LPLTTPIRFVCVTPEGILYEFDQHTVVTRQRIFPSWPQVQDALDKIEALVKHNGLTDTRITMFLPAKERSLLELEQACQRVNLPLLVQWLDMKTADDPNREVQECLSQLHRALQRVGVEFNLDLKPRVPVDSNPDSDPDDIPDLSEDEAFWQNAKLVKH